MAAFCCLATLCASGATHAQLVVDRSVIEFGGDVRTRDIELTNTGDYRLYLDLSVAEIVAPESPSPERVELSDPRTAPVIVTPRQLLVPPGERKRVRVIMRTVDAERDRIFRLAVKPYTGKVQVNAAAAGETASAVKVLVGYDLLLLSRPATADPRLSVRRDASGIEFTNAGNTNILLREIRQCDAAAPDDCVRFDPNRLYVGETHRIELPKRGPAERYPVEVLSSVGLDSERATY